MICTETISVGGKFYIRTWSDTGKMIERDGQKYESAVDPAHLGRVYTESDHPIPDDEIPAEEALDELREVLA